MDSDNTFVRSIDGGAQYFMIRVDNKGIYICRYCVPGRCDYYSFKTGELNSIISFSDFNNSIPKMISLLKNDLKTPYVKELLKTYGNGIVKSRVKRFIKRIICCNQIG